MNDTEGVDLALSDEGSTVNEVDCLFDGSFPGERSLTNNFVWYSVLFSLNHSTGLGKFFFRASWQGKQIPTIEWSLT